ncbi:hypothetical protein L0Y59_04860 [Candidatus Uhrbacteria bacterium]|nr:hypothetical protein [Candidatus Uhrbacteria bacterium]
MKKPALAKKTKLLLWILGGVLVVGTVATSVTVCSRQRSAFERRLRALESEKAVPSTVVVSNATTPKAAPSIDTSKMGYSDSDRIRVLEQNIQILTGSVRDIVRSKGIRLEGNTTGFSGIFWFTYPPLPILNVSKDANLYASYDEGVLDFSWKNLSDSTTLEDLCDAKETPQHDLVDINGISFCKESYNDHAMGGIFGEIISYSALSSDGETVATLTFESPVMYTYGPEDERIDNTTELKAFHAFVDSVMKTVRFEPKATP